MDAKDASKIIEGEIVYGTGWQATPKKLSFHHRSLVKDVIGAALGFCWIVINDVKRLAHIKNNVIRFADLTDVCHAVENYIDTDLPAVLAYSWKKHQLANLFVTGILNYVTVHKLRFLPVKEITEHFDTRTESFFYFLNGVVKVTAQGTELMDYKSLNGLIWDKQIRPYNITLNKGGEPDGDYKEFCFRLCDKNDAKYQSLKSIIGFMIHRFFSPTKTIIPCFLDESINGTDQSQANGSVGKTLLCEGLGYIRNVVDIDGKSFDPNGSFPYQRVNIDSEILFIDDLARNISFEFFFSILSIGLEVNQKNKPSFKLKKEKMPKPIITSNFPIKCISGRSVDRRKIEFEVPSYYDGKTRTPLKEFGREFYTDQWGPDDYNQMFNFFFECSAFYLKHGLIEPPEINAGQRKLIGELGGVDLKEFLDEKIIDAQLNIKDKLAKGVEDYMVKWNKKDLYDEFIKTYSGQQKYYPSPNRFTMKVTIYLKYRDVFVSADYGQRRMFLLNLSKLPALPEPEEQNNEEFGEVTESENEFKTLSDFKTNYILVNSVETHTLLLSKLKDSKAFTFDTETAGSESGSALTIHSLQLVGIGFCFSKNEAFYVPVPEDYTLAGKLLAHYKPHFENSATIKTGHNLKFDINVLCRYGITVNGQCFDTMIAHYLIDGDAEHGLKALSRNLLGYQQIEIEDIIGSGTHQTSMRQVPLKDVTDYASEDCDQTMQIAEALIPLLIEKQLDSLFYNVEMPMVNVLADMEYQGIKIDADVLGELEFQAREEIDLLTKQIFNVAGLEFKITSGKELGAVLFEKLNLPVITKTKTGDYSTSKPTLTKLRNEHPIIPLILKYKSTSSLLNTFISALPNYIHPDTGRVHTNFNQAFVVTGRLSSSNPNLQNIPHSNEGFGKEIRKAFIPRDENHVIISADYSQIELRVLSHFSNDPVMIDAFKNDMDLHTVTASKIFGVPVSEIAKDDKRRKVAKTINFGLNYLMSAKTLAERIAAETGEEIDVAKAKEYMDSYFAEFSGVRNYHEEAYQNATIKGYCTTLLGRRRYLPEIDSQIKSKRMASKRLAVNFPIQGSAASIIKKAMINLHQELINGGFKTKILLQIHDELVFDCPKEELEAVIPIIKRVMEAAVELKVPLKVDIGKGANWLEAH